MALLAVLDNGRIALRALHGYEALAGMLVPDTGEGATAAALALSALAEARAEGVDLDRLTETHPVVLALVPPRVFGDPTAVPPVVATVPDGQPPAPPVATSDAAVVREALRLRARWVQELTARAAAELGVRLARVGVLPDPSSVRLLGVDELHTAARTRYIPADLDERVDPADERPRPLPARFRLTAGNTPVALATGSGPESNTWGARGVTSSRRAK